MSSEDDQLYRRSPHTAWQLLDGEGGVILHLQAHELTATNGTGAVIWRALDTPRSLHQLTELLLQEFEVGPVEAREAIRAFLVQLQAKALIEPVAEPGG